MSVIFRSTRKYPIRNDWKRNMQIFGTLRINKGTRKRHGTARNLRNEKVVSSISDPRFDDGLTGDSFLELGGGVGDALV